MNIGMILDTSFPPDNRVENEAISLIKNGHEVFLFCLNLKKRKEKEIINSIRVHRFLFNRRIYNKISPLAYTFPIYHLLLKRKIDFFLKTYKLDVIHIHDMAIAGLIFKLNKRHKLPIVLDLHENRPEIMKAYSHVNSGLGKYLISLKKWEEKQIEFIKKADKLIVVTEEAKNEIVNNNYSNPIKIYVVPNTVNLEIFLNYPIYDHIISMYQEYFSILYLGSTGIRRGLITAIKAINLLKKEIPKIKLIIVGKSRDDKYLKNICNEMELTDFIDFCGWQDVKKFPSYIEACKICISPLKRNRHHDTTYANKIFQYMSLGKPVVISDCTAQKNIVEETNCGLVHKADDANDLAEKILLLYNDSQLASKFGQNGRKAVLQKYNWEVTSKNLIKLYTELFD